MYYIHPETITNIFPIDKKQRETHSPFFLQETLFLRENFLHPNVSLSHFFLRHSSRLSDTLFYITFSALLA